MPTSVDSILAQVAASRDGHEGDLAAVFARTSLQRVPAGLLDEADHDVVVAWLLAGWDTLAHADPASTDLSLELRNPDVGLDGRPEPGTVVEVAGRDRPFIISSLTATLRDLGLAVIRSVHPILGVRRDEGGRVTELVPARDAEEPRTVVQLHLDRRLDDTRIPAVHGRLRTALDDVVRVTDDHDAIRGRLHGLADHLDATAPTNGGEDDPAEVAALLRWLADDHMVLLGWRDYRVDHDADEPTIRAEPGLGLLRDLEGSRFAEPVPMSALDDEHRRRFTEGRLLRVSRTNRASTVHRVSRMDYVGIIEVDDDGRPLVEHRLLGLFTAAAFAAPTSTVPVLRRRLEQVRQAQDVVAGSHDDALFTALFQALPTDELFQTDPDELSATLVALAQAEERGRIRVVTRVEPFTSTVSVILAVPRDDWSPTLRTDLQQLLADAWQADAVEVDLALGDRTEALARFVVSVSGEMPDVDVAAVEAAIRARARSWGDRMRDALVHAFGERDGHRRHRHWSLRLPTTYRTSAPVEVIVDDVRRLDEHDASGGDPCVWLHPDGDGLRLKIAHADEGMALSDLLPLVEALGLRVLGQVPHVLVGEGPAITVHDLTVEAPAGFADLDPESDGARIAETIVASHAGRCAVDDLHRLVTTAGLSWRDVAVLRAYRRYRRQVGTAYATNTLNDALVANPVVARRLVRVFRHRFHPDLERRDVVAARDAVLAACDEVVRLDHDRILRDLLALVEATLRTNAYRTDRLAENRHGVAVPYLALKFDSSLVPGVPDPTPYREIFVHSPDVEGIHLRGGPIARGGLRWSDRRDDTRTEVLGLMQAQMLKNAVIVPEGAKGGFTLGDPPADAGELRDEVRRQYTTFIRALLDVTDNVVDGVVVPPLDVRRLDGDDPYLVVAADKGTATFSDVANTIAKSVGFWLGDAFASGGSVGYDHKGLGITARGAWVATARHFAELGVDLQADPVTVVGVGDMSGDVFGNGMLLSQSLRLVAAFDHRDVFLDPDPDPTASFAERRRLFELPRSSWQDYDRNVLSPGGMVVSRAEKSVTPSPEVAARLGIEAAPLAPDDLIRHVLRARVDLLYFGGIGTYVAAPGESDADIGDRTNDEVRVRADEVRARVVTEGANLAVTQPGRIAYARRGGRIDQDAVHNAAGVDISDHEVNLKILLDLAVADGRLDEAGRAEWLHELSDAVVDLVLGDVDRQCARLSRDVESATSSMEQWAAAIQSLADGGWVDRGVHHLPSDTELADRAAAGAGLTRPELATVLASSKRWLTSCLLADGLASSPGLADALDRYFPDAVVATFADLLPQHRLRDELVATTVANAVVDQFGPVHVHQLATETGHAPSRIVGALWAARRVVDADRWWRTARRISWLAPARVESLVAPIDDVVTTLARQYLDDPLLDDVAGLVARDRPVWDELLPALSSLGSERQRSRAERRAGQFRDDLVDDDLALVVAHAHVAAMTADVSAIHRASGESPPQVADALLLVDERLQLDEVRAAIHALDTDDTWTARARSGLDADVRRLRHDAVAGARGADVLADAVDRRFPADHPRVRRVREVVRLAVAAPTHASVAVAVRALQDLLRPI